MITTERENNSLGLTPLVTGIIEDAQQLLKHQLSLFKADIQADLRRGKAAAAPLAVGIGAGQLAGFCVILMCAHLVVWIWPQTPLFAVYGALGVVLAIIAVALIILGKNETDKLTQVMEQSVEGLKENVEWTTNK